MPLILDPRVPSFVPGCNVGCKKYSATVNGFFVGFVTPGISGAIFGTVFGGPTSPEGFGGYSTFVSAGVAAGTGMGIGYLNFGSASSFGFSFEIGTDYGVEAFIGYAHVSDIEESCQPTE